MEIPPGFEWDPAKAETNFRRHRVTFEEAATAFVDPLSSTIYDAGHSHEEDRFVLYGRSYRGRLLVVVHTDRDNNIRLISARPADPSEKRSYERER